MAVDPFATRSLGRSAVQVSRLGMGTLPLGDLYVALSDQQAEETIAHALNLGIRYVDTAPAYGYGLAEERTGRALGRADRSKWVLSTKVGRPLGHDLPVDSAGMAERRRLWASPRDASLTWDFSYEGTLACFEESLGRLGLDRVDIALIHDPDRYSTSAEDLDRYFGEAVDGAYVALERLRTEGRVSAIGFGITRPGMAANFVRETDIDCVLIAGAYTLLEQGALAELLPLCGRRGVGVILGGAYNSGILANADADPSDLASSATYRHRAVPPEIRARVDRLTATCARHGVPLKAAAAQFPFAHPTVSSVLMGVRSPAEIDDNVAMLVRPIPADLWAELRDEELLPLDAPAPVDAGPEPRHEGRP
jgi:D-threo-aldose 1-dehydrogenase